VILHKLKSEILDNIEYNRLKNPVTYRDIGHQVRKKRLLWSVRRLVSEYWEQSLSKLMPCWLASPESVAAIFPMKQGWFDLVIFDEASQCYVERALPVILRGKNCVIAGDDKQLPPFDLYSVKVEDFEEAFADNEMAMEVESALDLARNLFSESKLNWHYRSREEELINFSNHAFYDGRLNIIPPANSLPAYQPPIEFMRVEGIWEKNTNEAEARHILQLVEELIQRSDNPSIGIVTFNYHQKELIRDLLERRLQELGSSGGNPALLSLFTAALERTEEEEYQGIFVKNIENVQGDERDIIIFSVGYARTTEGRLVANFGLLSQRGGENRLNVAITRARQKVYVVSSFEPEELKVEGAKHAGPLLFKRYLQYARAVSEGRTEDVNHLLQQLNVNDTFAKEVHPGLPGDKTLADLLYDALTAKGLDLSRDVGDTNYKIDLAVKDGNGAFLLGIECEGRNYFNGRSSKEREVYRHGLMALRGWQVYRVWARNYFLKPDAVVAEILELVEGLRNKE
jgi:very-short-patch-repair endonuclease